MAINALFVAIEGLDGSGKSTIARHLTDLLERLLGQPVKLTYEPHDPSCGGDYIREVLARKITAFTPRTLMLAFAANRLDHCSREIDPWLDQDDFQILLCDRYYLSSLVYQSNEEFSFEDIMEANKAARKPDLTIFMDVSNAVCLERMQIRNKPQELFEKNLSETRTKYRSAIQYLRENREENIVLVNADGTVEEVLREVVKVVSNHLPLPQQVQMKDPIDLIANSLNAGESVLNLKGIDHIGIAVHNLKETLEMYDRLFDLKPFHSELIPDQKVRVSFLKMGDQKLELIEATSDESPIYNYLQKRGEGLHHIAFRVADIYTALKAVSSRGFRLIDQKPRKGAMNKWIAFIHPKDTNGVLIELCQTIHV